MWKAIRVNMVHLLVKIATSAQKKPKKKKTPLTILRGRLGMTGEGEGWLLLKS